MSLVLRNARVVGGADAPVDLRVRHGVIDEVGSGLTSKLVVDLGGRWVIPGLWDAHVHFTAAAITARRLDVSAATSAAQAAELVRQRIAADPPEPGAVLVGFGYRDGLWPDAPAEGLLDAGQHAVALISSDSHSIWSNAAARRVVGLPEDGWLLREQAAFDLIQRLGAVGEAAADEWALDFAAQAARRGVVGIRDLEMGGAPWAWRRRYAAGFRGLRVAAGVYPVDLDRAVAEGLRTGDGIEGSAGLGEVGNYKLFTDGALGSRTAWTDDAYPGTRDHGLAIYRGDGLLDEARSARAAGLEPTIHAIGDAAVAAALDVFEQLGGPGRIEHAQLVRDADFARFAALGVVASVQPEHAMDDRDDADRYWERSAGRAYAYRSLLDAGAVLEFGSDAPVAPLDPWFAISAAVERGRDGREPWHPEQALTVAEALAASVRSRIAVGEPGDLVVLDEDPLTTQNLREPPVAATLVAGEWSSTTLG